jgi:hypothetical protein
VTAAGIASVPLVCLSSGFPDQGDRSLVTETRQKSLRHAPQFEMRGHGRGTVDTRDTFTPNET